MEVPEWGTIAKNDKEITKLSLGGNLLLIGDTKSYKNVMFCDH